MALSKMPSVNDRLLLEKLEQQQDQAVDEILEAAFSALPAFRRSLRPFVEIGLDCCELGATLTRSFLSVEARHPASKRLQNGALELRPCAELEEHEAEAEAKTDASFCSHPLVRRRMRCRLEGLMEGLAEIADDLEMDRLQVFRTCTMLGALLIPGASVGGAALGSLSGGSLQALLQLCSLNLPASAVVHASALMYCMCGMILYNRQPEMRCRTMQKTAAMTCLFALLGDVGVLYMDKFGTPSFLLDVVDLMAQPTVALKLLPLVVCVPLAIANVGYISGKTADKMKSCIALGALSSVGFIGTCVAKDIFHQSLMLMGSAGCTLRAVTLLGVLQDEAAVVSVLNRRRAMVGGDLLSFGWTWIPMVQGLGVLHIISTNFEIVLLEMSVLTMLLGTHHIVMRSSQAVEKAVDANKRCTMRNGEAPGQREPLNEADIRS